VQFLFDIVSAVIIFCGSEIENLTVGLIRQLTCRILRILATPVVPTCSNWTPQDR